MHKIADNKLIYVQIKFYQSIFTFVDAIRQYDSLISKHDFSDSWPGLANIVKEYIHSEYVNDKTFF